MVVCSGVFAVLAPVVGGEQQQGIASKKQARYTIQQTSQISVDDITQQARSTALDEVNAGPDPFFADLVGRPPFEGAEQETDQSAADEVVLPRTRLVEVYENESRGLGRRWRELLPGRLSAFATPQWSYKVIQYDVRWRYHGQLASADGFCTN